MDSAPHTLDICSSSTAAAATSTIGYLVAIPTDASEMLVWAIPSSTSTTTTSNSKKRRSSSGVLVKPIPAQASFKYMSTTSTPMSKEVSVPILGACFYGIDANNQQRVVVARGNALKPVFEVLVREDR